MASRRIDSRGGEYVLAGTICCGRKWDDEVATPFHMRFGSENFIRAQKTALERIKAFAKRHMGKSRAKKFLTDGVTLVDCKNPKNVVVVRVCRRNNSLLFEKKAYNVFQPLS